MSDEILTLEEAAAIVRCNPKTLRRAIERGEAPGTRLGRMWRIPKAALLEYLAKGPQPAEGGVPADA